MQGYVVIAVYAVVLLALLVSVLQMAIGDAVTVKQTDHEKQLMWYFDVIDEAFVSVDRLVDRGIVAAELVDRLKEGLQDPVGFRFGGRCGPDICVPAAESGGPIMVDNKGQERPVMDGRPLARLYYGS